MSEKTNKTNSSPSIEVYINREILNKSNKSKINTSPFNLSNISTKRFHYTTNSSVDQLSDVISELKQKCKTNEKNLNKSKYDIELIKLKIKRLKVLEDKAKTTYNNKIKNLRNIRKNKEQKINDKKLKKEQENKKNIELIKQKQKIQFLRENWKTNLEKAKKTNEDNKEKNARLIHNQKIQHLFFIQKERQDDMNKKKKKINTLKKMIEDSEKKKQDQLYKKKIQEKKNLEEKIFNQLKESQIIQKEKQNYENEKEKIVTEMGKLEGIFFV